MVSMRLTPCGKETSMGDAQPYVYSPLAKHSIRLLSLGATRSSGALETFSIDQAPPYFALSYAWGNQTDDVPLEVDGRLLGVTPSLASAIEQLRKLTLDDAAPSVQRVWVDRICINQDDLPERSSQVQMMEYIYSRAIRTLIWLGPASEDYSAAWQLVDQIYGAFRKEYPLAEHAGDIGLRFYSDENHTALGLPPWNSTLWQQLRRLFELPWFTRIWIIQEVVLSQKDPVLLLGHQSYPWHRLGWASFWLRRSGYLRLAQVPSRFQNVDTISNIQRSAVPWRIDALLATTSIKCHATEQCDKLYGLLGMAAKSDTYLSGPLRPDYQLDVSDVYTRAAIFLIREYKSLAVLTRAGGGWSDGHSQAKRKYQLEHLPSWVPNWCDHSVAEIDVVKSLSWIFPPDKTGAGTLGFPEHYRASSGFPVQLLPSPEPSLLRLTGMRVDTVVKAIPFGTNPHDRHLGQDSADPPLLQLWRMALPLSEKMIFTDWMASWVKTTTAAHHELSGRTEDQTLKDGSAYIYELLRSSEHFLHEERTLEALRVLSLGGTAEMYAALARNFCFNRKFFVTREGRMGIGPLATQPGDSVAVIWGGGVPYVLRPQGNNFLFIGESYVHQLMTGEAVRAWKQGHLVEEVLELR